MTLLLLLRCHNYGATPATAPGQRGLRAVLSETGSPTARIAPGQVRAAVLTPVKPPGGTIS